MPQELEDRIINALAAFHTAEKPKIATIARGRIHGRKSRNERSGPNKALEPEQEKALILCIDTLDQAFSPPSTLQSVTIKRRPISNTLSNHRGRTCRNMQPNPYNPKDQEKPGPKRQHNGE